MSRSLLPSLLRSLQRRIPALCAAALLGLALPLAALPPAPVEAPLPAVLDDLQHRAFDFFWERGDPKTGLIPDRYPTPSFAHIGGVGFALTAYPIGVERGWVTRKAARERVLTTLRYLHDAPQGPQVSGTTGYKGFFYRYLDMDTGTRSGQIELSTMDTSLLLGGVLFVESYFDRKDADEVEIRRLAEAIYARVDWKWMQVRGAAIAHGWVPDTRRAAADLLVAGKAGPGKGPVPGHLLLDWKGNCEAMIVYLMALGAPRHGVGPEAWAAWTSTYDKDWAKLWGYEHLTFVSLFSHQFTQTWFDLRGVQDAYMRTKGIDYFENSRRAAQAQRAYTIANPGKWKDYGSEVWGLSATDGPADLKLPYQGTERSFRTYAARGVSPHEVVDDGTLSPSGIISSLPFAPEIVIPGVENMARRYGGFALGRYGFFEALNPSFEYPVLLHHGRVVKGFGWVDTDWLAIDQGPIVAMVENYRSGLVWRTLRGNPHVQRALRKAGFTGGWLDRLGKAKQ